MSNPGSYPPLVQSALSKMTDEQKLTFEAEYARRRKNTALYVFLAIIFSYSARLIGTFGFAVDFLAYWRWSGYLVDRRVVFDS